MKNSSNKKADSFSKISWEDFLELCKKTSQKNKISSSFLWSMSSHFMKNQPMEIQKKYYENLGVFNKAGNPLGKANWYFVYKFGCVHTASSILVIDKTDKIILIQERSKNVSWAGLLDTSAGGCFPDKIISKKQRLDYLIHELSEEIFSNYRPKNISRSTLKEISKTYLEVKDREFIKRQFLYFYTFALDPADKEKIKKNWESADLKWMTADQIKKISKKELAPGLKTALATIEIDKLF